MYIVVNATTKLRQTYQKAVMKDIIINREKQALKSYNIYVRASLAW